MTDKRPLHIVWFKRDLRIHDHAALSQAALKGNILPLYILEPDLWHQPDMSKRQYDFLVDCLKELNLALQTLGSKLVIKVGEAIPVLQAIEDGHQVASLWSHQECWNAWTYRRDLTVKKWTEDRKIPWFEPTQNGVIRRLKDRDGWSSQWYHLMKQSRIVAPERLSLPTLSSDALPRAAEISLKDDGLLDPQRGGRSEGLALMRSFLSDRGEGYTKEMSSPVTAFESCSRLSAHLAFGTLSIREVFQAIDQKTKAIKTLSKTEKGRWPSALRSFSGRLRWHCHFIQKLEDEPRIEFEEMHPAYIGLRKESFDPIRFDAWALGRTGYPMVDACMRALIATGWLNFRMRAMVMSFASYHLWQPWQKTAPYLASLFTDYEPGIHYPQVQMQSGTTGINSIRIYNPIKQGVDQDPEGTFIRQWVPELAEMPQDFIHQPWLLPDHLNGYPMPIVEEAVARKQAASQLYSLRKTQTHRETAQQIVKKHGSRKRPNDRPNRPRKKAAPSIAQSQQGELPL